jgi:hypothetical protein
MKDGIFNYSTGLKWLDLLGVYRERVNRRKDKFIEQVINKVK